MVFRRQGDRYGLADNAAPRPLSARTTAKDHFPNGRVVSVGHPLLLRVVATMASTAVSGATRAMKSPTGRLPSAARAAVNPTTRTATVISDQSWRNSRAPIAGATISGFATAETVLVSRRSDRPSRSRTDTVRFPGLSATSSRSSGLAGSEDWDTAPPPAAHATTCWALVCRTR